MIEDLGTPTIEVTETYYFKVNKDRADVTTLIYFPRSRQIVSDGYKSGEIIIHDLDSSTSEKVRFSTYISSSSDLETTRLLKLYDDDIFIWIGRVDEYGSDCHILLVSLTQKTDVFGMKFDSDDFGYIEAITQIPGTNTLCILSEMEGTNRALLFFEIPLEEARSKIIEQKKFFLDKEKISKMILLSDKNVVLEISELTQEIYKKEYVFLSVGDLSCAKFRFSQNHKYSLYFNVEQEGEFFFQFNFNSFLFENVIWMDLLFDSDVHKQLIFAFVVVSNDRNEDLLVIGGGEDIFVVHCPTRRIIQKIEREVSARFMETRRIEVLRNSFLVTVGGREGKFRFFDVKKNFTQLARKSGEYLEDFHFDFHDGGPVDGICVFQVKRDEIHVASCSNDHTVRVNKIKGFIIEEELSVFERQDLVERTTFLRERKEMFCFSAGEKKKIHFSVQISSTRIESFRSLFL